MSCVMIDENLKCNLKNLGMNCISHIESHFIAFPCKYLHYSAGAFCYISTRAAVSVVLCIDTCRRVL